MKPNRANMNLPVQVLMMMMMMIMMMMMMMIMMNCFCCMVERRRAFNLVSRRDIVRDPHHRESPIRLKQDLNLHRT